MGRAPQPAGDRLAGYAGVAIFYVVLPAAVLGLLWFLCSPMGNGDHDNDAREATYSEVKAMLDRVPIDVNEMDGKLIKGSAVENVRQIDDFYWCFTGVYLTADDSATGGWKRHTYESCLRAAWETDENRLITGDVNDRDRARLKREGKWPAGGTADDI